MAKSRLVPFRGLDVRLPDPTRLAGHNFVHHRVNDANRPSPVELRWLLDMALIMARHEAAIDWSELDRYCVQTGQGEVLATYLAFGETLLGRQSPALTARPDGDAMRKLRQYIDPSERRPGRDVDVVSHRFSGADAAHVAGHCWRVPLPNEFLQGDTSLHPAT